MAEATRPAVGFLLAHPAHLVALGFGSGLAPFAPGTFGSLFGWLSYDLLDLWLPRVAWYGLLPLVLALGIWACDRTGRDLGVADHGAMVFDEIVAMWLVLLCVPSELVWQGLAFLLFRLFDVVKPPPIGWLERRIKGGAGVMADDLLAALYAVIAVGLVGWSWGRWHG